VLPRAGAAEIAKAAKAGAVGGTVRHAIADPAGDRRWPADEADEAGLAACRESVR
jgi:hypothetical protein